MLLGFFYFLAFLVFSEWSFLNVISLYGKTQTSDCHTDWCSFHWLIITFGKAPLHYLSSHIFLSVCCIFSSFVRKLSFVRFCYEWCSRFNFECKTKTHKSQKRIELRFPSLCSEEQEVEEKPPGSQEKANCPDDKVRIWTFFECILFWIRLKHH